MKKQAEQIEQAEQTKQVLLPWVQSEKIEDATLAKDGWRRSGLYFRNVGYNSDDWLYPAIRYKEDQDLIERKSISLMHLNLHPLASYRALGLSNVVDHWVPLVATEGWDVLTQERPYVLQRLGPQRQWGHIEHPMFWKEVALMLALNDTTAVESQKLLREAGWAGNVIPFGAMPPAQVEAYSLSKQTCHPRVALWLQSRGFWGPENLLPSLGGWRDLFPLTGYAFLEWQAQSPVPIAHVLDWVEPMLSQYALSKEQKVSLIGQMILAFGIALWEKHFKSTCLPYLDDINLRLLYAVCSKSTASSTSLETTVATLTQNVLVPFKAEIPDPQYLPNNTMHPGLLFLLTVHPPQNRADLYMLAELALKMELGLIKAPESIALPNLDN